MQRRRRHEGGQDPARPQADPGSARLLSVRCLPHRLEKGPPPLGQSSPLATLQTLVHTPEVRGLMAPMPIESSQEPSAGLSVPHSDLQHMVEAAVLAPSPDNNQPWAFQIRENSEILLYHDVSRALPSDVGYMFSLIALGAALENLCIAARG